MSSTLKPAVLRHHLLAISGLLWSAAGILLCWRAWVWLSNFQLGVEIPFELLGITLAITFYFFGFLQIARKNIARICSLPEKACLFAFTAWKGYLIIGTMIAAGILLRNSSIPKDYLAVPYTAMGGALLFASIQFYVRYIRIVVWKKS